MADITYNKINWENEPSHNTPLSASNLNKMDTAIYDLVTKSNSLVPNPAESPTEGLEKLEYDGTVYEVKGGHKILNDSGSVLTQMDNMQFNGVYTHNASTITEVDIVREFSTVAEIESLTGEEAKGIQYVEGDADYIPFDAKDIQFDNTGTSYLSDDVDGVLREVDDKIDGISVLKINANTYPTWGQALTALASAYDTLTQAQKERSYLLWNGRIKLTIQDLSNSNRAFSFVAAGLNSIIVRSMFVASTPYYLVGTIGTSTSIVNNTSSAQAESIELKY